MTSKEELRISVEYSKSGRSSCKSCKRTVAQDSIRVGKETKSRVFDGYDIAWYHLKCFKFTGSVFFIKQLKHFELLRWSDQMQLRELIGDKSEIKNQMIKENYYNDVWKIKDGLIADNLKPAVIKSIYHLNYHSPSGISPASVLHQIADGLTYGRIGPCPNCNCLSVCFDGENFYCKGWVSSFSRCDWYGPDCKRYKFKLPSGLKSPFLANFSYSHHHPIEELVDYKPPSHINADGELSSGGAEQSQESEQSAPVKVKPMPKPGSVLLKVNEEFSGYAKGNAEIAVEESPVYGFTPYNVTLNLTDLITNNNSYYILQLIKAGSRYYCFCKWGRIGVSYGKAGGGGSTDHQFHSINEALKEFKEKFFDKTGFEWDNRGKFSKIPGKYYLVEIDDDSHDEHFDQPEQNFVVDMRPSILPERVQKLVQHLFDENLMKQQLAYLQFDVNKMPLGKISQNQIKSAYTVLTEIQDLLDQEVAPSKSKIFEISARFYTLIPHNFGGSGVIPPIDNKKTLIEKMKLVDMLSEIEVVNSLKKRLASLKSSGNSIDDKYSQLSTKIEPLDISSFEYRSIEDIAHSTLDPEETFSANVVDIFRVDRAGEEAIYREKWEFCHNKMYLWHGSRTTNFVGILSQGLRIAPPSAPKSGYRFGKGVYFADSSSTSIGYTGTNQENNIAILALTEVALGSSEALYQDSYMEKANEGYQSTKAIGSRAPHTYDSFNDITVLKGPMVSHPVQSSVVHNEYVVYDTSQINIKYLVLFKINQK